MVRHNLPSNDFLLDLLPTQAVEADVASVRPARTVATDGEDLVTDVQAPEYLEDIDQLHEEVYFPLLQLVSQWPIVIEGPVPRNLDLELLSTGENDFHLMNHFPEMNEVGDSSAFAKWQVQMELFPLRVSEGQRRAHVCVEGDHFCGSPS